MTAHGIKIIVALLSLVFSLDSFGAIYQNFYVAQANPTNRNNVTVSPYGIANGLSTTTNNGANYGPDTPGTSTCGIQEALNAFNRGTNYGPYMASVPITLLPGNFFYTNKIYLTNQFTYSVNIKGSGMLDTTLIYAGAETGINCMEFRGGTNRPGAILNLPLHFQISDLTITALNQTTNIMLWVTNFSYAKLENLNITSWKARTNQFSGSAVSMYPQAEAPQGLVGAVIASPSLEHATVIQNIFLADLAVGFFIQVDHLSAEDIRTALISYWPGSATNWNQWPSNSIFSTGGAIVQSSGYDSLYKYCHFYAARNSFVGVNLQHSPTIIGGHWEGGVDILSDNQFSPTLIQPVATGGSPDAFFSFVLKSPSGLSNAAINWQTNYFLKTSIAQPYSGSFGRWPYPADSMYFYVSVANTNVFQISTNGTESLVPFTAPAINASTGSVSGVLVVGNINGSSNAISAWPTAPLTSGGYSIVNSNGTVFVLTSGLGNTWTATNKIAP